MEINQVANDLIEAIDNYLKASMKTEYIFSDLEDMRITRAITILTRHLDTLSDYERKREKEDK